MNHNSNTNLFPFLLFSLLALILFLSLNLPLLDVDAAQYAHLSKELLKQPNPLIIKHSGENYLDKPPLLFWITAIFFKLFTVQAWVYKIPSLLVFGLGIFAFYHHIKNKFNPLLAQYTLVFLLSSQAFFMLCIDIRTDTMLLGWILLSIYFFDAYFKNQKLKHCIAAFTCMGLAIVTKGPLGLIIPFIFSFFSFLQNKETYKYKYWDLALGSLILLLVLCPMLYGLYLQWGKEGLYFFFWKQSFGRITGENVWSNNYGYFYFFHTILWVILPWTGIAVLYLLSGNPLAQFKKSNPSFPYFLSFLLIFFFMSLSKYKLPHYIFPSIPFLAVSVSVFTSRIKPHLLKHLLRFHIFLQISIIITSLLFLLSYSNFMGYLAVLSSLFFFFWTYRFSCSDAKKLQNRMLSISMSIVLFLGFQFYPFLNQFHSGYHAAQDVNHNKINTNILVFNHISNSFEFYCHAPTLRINTLEDLWIHARSNQLVITNEEGMSKIKSSSLEFKMVKTYKHYHISKFKPKFLVPSKRKELLENIYLLELKSILG